MRVMVMVKASKESEAGTMPGAELITAMGNYNQELIKAGVLLDGGGLTPSSRGARVKFLANNKRAVIDGPFTETKELVSGFWILQVKSLEEAVEWIKRCPNPTPGQEPEVEIRPFFEPAEFTEATPEQIAAEEKFMASKRKQ